MGNGHESSGDESDLPESQDLFFTPKTKGSVTSQSKKNNKRKKEILTPSPNVNNTLQKKAKTVGRNTNTEIAPVGTENSSQNLNLVEVVLSNGAEKWC